MRKHDINGIILLVITAVFLMVTSAYGARKYQWPMDKTKSVQTDYEDNKENMVVPSVPALTGRHYLNLKYTHSLDFEDPFNLNNSNSLKTHFAGAGYAIHQPMDELNWADSDQLTIEFWTKPLNDGLIQKYASIESNENAARTTSVYLQRVNNAKDSTETATRDYLKFRLYIEGAGSDHIDLPQVHIPTNQWTHIAMIYNYDYLNFYVNGLNVASYASKVVDPTNGVSWLRRSFPKGSSLDWSCGRTDQPGPSSLMDDVGVFTYAKEPSELGYFRSYTPEPAAMAMVSIMAFAALKRTKAA